MTRERGSRGTKVEEVGEYPREGCHGISRRVLIEAIWGRVARDPHGDIGGREAKQGRSWGREVTTRVSRVSSRVPA